MGIVFPQPVAMRRAVFWRVCSFLILVWALGSVGQPDGSSVEDYGSDLYAVTIVLFCWPQLVPARDIKMLRRGVMRETRLFMCGPKVK